MTLINLKSDGGQKLLKEAVAMETAQPHLGNVFSKQTLPASCGIQSFALLASAARFHVHQKVTVTEHDLLATEAIGNLPNMSGFVQERGLTLQDLFNVISASGHKVEMKYASDFSLSDLRAAILSVVKDPSSSTGIIANYHMETLGQDATYGHHSPLGAYHQETDRVLIYDCWPKTEECWATVENLYFAMREIDSDSGKSRGCVTIQFQQ